MPTRDSIVWWLGIVGGLIVYLAAAAPPTQWDYYAWLQFAGVVIATVSGKLATSPLAGAPKDNIVTHIPKG